MEKISTLKTAAKSAAITALRERIRNFHRERGLFAGKWEAFSGRVRAAIGRVVRARNIPDEQTGHGREKVTGTPGEGSRN